MVCITEEERIGEKEIFRKIGHQEGTPEEQAKAHDEFCITMAKVLGISLQEARTKYTSLKE